MRPKVFVCQPVPEVALKRMREFAEVEVFPFSHRAISVGELESAARRSNYIFCMHETPVTASIAEANPDLRGFALGRAHPEIVDIEACRRVGVPLLEANGPGRTGAPRPAMGHATSDLMVAHILNLAYRVIEADRYCRRHDGYFQERTIALEGLGTTDKVCSLIGFGRVARGAVPTLQGIGMKVLYNKRTRLEPGEEEALGVSWVGDLDELIGRGDFVCMCVNYLPENYEMMGEREFKLMKPNAYFVNVARGRLVDEEAMIAALKARTIAGAGLDVFYSEPPNNVDPRIPDELLEMENVTLTPHSGGATWDNRSRMTLAIAEVIVEDILARERVAS